MFDPFQGWPEDFAVPNRHRVHPPRPVVVHLGALLPRPAGSAPTVPLRVSQGGLDLTGDAAGELLAWVRVHTGEWIALVRIIARTRNRKGEVPMLQWVPAAALQPAPPPAL